MVYLSDMSSFPMVNNIVGGRVMYFIILSDLRYRVTFYIHNSHIPNVSLTQLRRIVSLAPRWMRSPFVQCVNLVITTGSKKQVRGITAGRIVANVTYQKIAWICFSRYEVGDSVGGKRLTPQLESPVLLAFLFILRSGPRPATVLGTVTCYELIKPFDLLSCKTWQFKMRSSHIRLLCRLIGQACRDVSSMTTGHFYYIREAVV